MIGLLQQCLAPSPVVRIVQYGVLLLVLYQSFGDPRDASHHLPGVLDKATRGSVLILTRERCNPYAGAFASKVLVTPHLHTVDHPPQPTAPTRPAAPTRPTRASPLTAPTRLEAKNRTDAVDYQPQPNRTHAAITGHCHGPHRRGLRPNNVSTWPHLTDNHAYERLTYCPFQRGVTTAAD